MRFLRAVRRTWLPILAGAAWGTAVSFVALAALLVVIESRRVERGVLLPSRSYDFADFAMASAALLLFAAHGGAIYGYITRRPR